MRTKKEALQPSSPKRSKPRWDAPTPFPPRPPAKVEDLIAETLVRVNAIAAGKELFLPDVLTDTAWQTLTSGERKGFGKMFRKVVERDAQPIAKQVRRASNNLAVYLKV